jgi:hypothetical protein
MRVGPASDGSTPPLPQRTRGAAGPQVPIAEEPAAPAATEVEEGAPVAADEPAAVDDVPAERLASITPLTRLASYAASEKAQGTAEDTTDDTADDTADDVADATAEHDAAEPAEETEEVAPAPAIRAVPDLPVRRPALSADDGESPIFRSLQSSWLSRGGNTAWATREIDEGWQAAARATEEKPVEETPETEKTTAGLPMRRPGTRVVPGGVAQKVADSTPARPLRDPEAIRARLAAHRAGVNRGRHATSATPTDSTHKEA